MKIGSLEVTKIVIYRNPRGTSRDKIYFRTDAKTTFPRFEGEAVDFTVDTMRGYAEKWIAETFAGQEYPEPVINEF